MTNKNGHLYSTFDFDGLLYRADIEFHKEGRKTIETASVFTTNKNKDEVFAISKAAMIDKYSESVNNKHLKLISFKPKAQDNTCFVSYYFF